MENKKLNINEIVSKLSNKVWRKRGKWHHSAIFSEVFGEGESTLYCQKIGYPFKRGLLVWLPNGDYLDLQEDWDDIRKIIDKGYKKDPLYLEKYSNDCLKKADELVAFAQNIKKQKIKTLSNETLAEFYINLIEEQKRFIPFMLSLHLVDELLTERFTAKLSAFIKNKSLTQSDFFDYQTALTFPYRKILVLEEQDNLMKIALKAKKNGLKVTDPEIDKLLEKHRENYSWINAILLERLPYTKEYFAKQLSQLLLTDVEADYSIKSNAEKKIKNDQKECMKNINSDPELVALSKEIQVFGFLRSYRIDVLFYSYVMALNLVEEIAKRLHLSVIEVKYLDSREISKALSGKAGFDYKRLIEERKKSYVSVMVENERYEISGEDVEKIVSVIKLPEEKKDGIIKGSVAYPGKITAKCKVLFSLDDMKKMEKGEVLVISMTDPNYLPVMSKASAFVTDQGGILCHAAIVSREMKKPCIIGTKIATKVLHDGDLVEVDANKGIVKKIK